MPRRAGHWIALLRLCLVAVAVVDVALTAPPDGYGVWAWIVAPTSIAARARPRT